VFVHFYYKTSKSYLLLPLHSLVTQIFQTFVVHWCKCIFYSEGQSTIRAKELVSVELSLWAQLDVENVQVEFLYTTCTRCIVCCNNMNLFDAPFSVPSKSFISLCTYQKDVFLCTQQKDNFCFHMLGYQFWHVLIVYLKGAFPFFCMSFCHALEAVTKPHSWSSAE
jgi:hypothetical protein